MPLKLNGQPFALHPPSPTALKIVALLEKSPADELFTAEELARKLGTSRTYVSQSTRTRELAPYTHQAGRVRYYGHPKAIAQLRRELGANA